MPQEGILGYNSIFNGPQTTAQESLGISPMCGFLGPAQTYSLGAPKEVVWEPVSPPPGDSEVHELGRLSDYRTASQLQSADTILGSGEMQILLQ